MVNRGGSGQAEKKLKSFAFLLDKKHRRIVTIIKSITAREIFLSYPRIKKEILWSGALWTSGYYANTVGLYASKETITRYIQNQGREKKEYRQIYENQPELDFGL